jgi:hypothetical protein
VLTPTFVKERVKLGTVRFVPESFRRCLLRTDVGFLDFAWPCYSFLLIEAVRESTVLRCEATLIALLVVITQRD